MKNRIIQGIIIFALIYATLLTISFFDTQSRVKCEINNLFIEKSQYWQDSVMKINRLPGTASFIRSQEQYEAWISRDRIIRSVDGVLVIPQRYYTKTGIRETKNELSQAMMLLADRYDLAVVDSVWKKELKNAGYEADAAVHILIKNLWEMFPGGDTLITDIKTELRYNRLLREKNTFVTDTVKLGFCGQGRAISYIGLPTSTIIKHIVFLDEKLFIAIIAAVIYVTFFYICFLNAKIKEEEKKLHRKDEDIIALDILQYNCTARTLYNTANGKSVKLPSTQARLMELLAKAEGYTVAKSDICNEVWRLNEKDATSAYNSATWRLRENLQKIDGIRLVTIKDKALQLIVEKA